MMGPMKNIYKYILKDNKRVDDVIYNLRSLKFIGEYNGDRALRARAGIILTFLNKYSVTND